MPLAPTPIVPVPSKPKIGFSIDSIVGGGGREDRLHERVEIERDGSPMDVVEGSSSPRTRRIITRSPGAHSEGSDRPLSRSSSVESYPTSRHTPSMHNGHSMGNQRHHHHHHHHHHLPGLTSHMDYGRTQARSHSGGSTPNNSPSPPHRISHGDSPVSAHPQPPPGVVRPSPNYLGPPPGAATAAAVAAEQIKSLYGLQPGHGAGPQASQTEYHTQQFALAANLAAAQHFQASNLAVALQAHHGASPHGAPHGPYTHGAGSGPHPPPHPHQPPRDSYPLFPWLLSRHGRLFPHRFPAGLMTIELILLICHHRSHYVVNDSCFPILGLALHAVNTLLVAIYLFMFKPGPDIPGFLLQPFRKPKRIRTAFSPSQLLKLEHAFEKNHYVVGAERKQLAQTLSLTETQVRVYERTH
ncbi:hypothetical protein PV326_013816 [Microctonus aethiopoides]|nr:hypothetical protein PV326_013816 [Microctonus aethiopoides]